MLVMNRYHTVLYLKENYIFQSYRCCGSLLAKFLNTLLRCGVVHLPEFETFKVDGIGFVLLKKKKNYQSKRRKRWTLRESSEHGSEYLHIVVMA